MNRSLRIALLAATAAAVTLVAASWLRPRAVLATAVVRGRAIDAVYATGTVEAFDRVTVKAKASGSVRELLTREGAAVKKGDLLARIDNPVVSSELERGEVELSAASKQGASNAPQIAALQGQWHGMSAALDVARQDLARISALGASGAVSASEVDRARSATLQLEGQLAANEAQQRALRIDLTANEARQRANVRSLASRAADTEVRAPIDGVVLARTVEVGEVVAVNQPLFRVGDTRDLVLEVAVDEADVARVRAGGVGGPASVAAVSLYAFPRQVLAGRVFEVLPDAQRERKSFLVKVRLDAPPAGLRSGMSAEVNVIASAKEGALLAPTDAVVDGVAWVAVDGRARRRRVELGVRDLLHAEVLSGLAEGEWVVVQGQDTLTDGARVSVTPRAEDRPHGGAGAARAGGQSL